MTLLRLKLKCGDFIGLCRGGKRQRGRLLGCPIPVVISRRIGRRYSILANGLPFSSLKRLMWDRRRRRSVKPSGESIPWMRVIHSAWNSGGLLWSIWWYRLSVIMSSRADRSSCRTWLTLIYVLNFHAKASKVSLFTKRVRRFTENQCRSCRKELITVMTASCEKSQSCK